MFKNFVLFLLIALISCKSPTDENKSSGILSARVTAYITEPFIMDLITESASFHTRKRQAVDDHTIFGYMKVSRLISGEDEFDFLFDLHAFDSGEKRQRYDLNSSAAQGRISLMFQDQQSKQIIHHFISFSGHIAFQTLTDKEMIGSFEFSAYGKSDPSRILSVKGQFDCRRL